MRPLACILPLLLLGSCNGSGEAVAPGNAAAATVAADGKPFRTEALGTFNEPWAMAFIPRTS